MQVEGRPERDGGALELFWAGASLLTGNILGLGAEERLSVLTAWVGRLAQGQNRWLLACVGSWQNTELRPVPAVEL